MLDDFQGQFELKFILVREFLYEKARDRFEGPFLDHLWSENEYRYTMHNRTHFNSSPNFSFNSN